MKIVASLAALALAACAPALPPAAAPAPDDGRGTQIVRLLEESADAWNEGDLDGFLLPYAEGAETAFVGSSGIRRGKDAIRATYQRSYFGAGVPESRLSFEDIEVRPLDANHALAVGRYRLVRRDTGAQSATGWFSLVLQRQPAGWRIIHDHSS